jgi:hypothetical protein
MRILLPTILLFSVACVGSDVADVAVDAGGSQDAGTDSGATDAASPDGAAGPDAGPLDGGPVDAAPGDAGPPDAGPPPACSITVSPGFAAVNTLGAAIAAAAPKDRICLMPGNYAQGDGQTYPLNVPAGVVLLRAPGASGAIRLVGAPTIPTLVFADGGGVSGIDFASGSPAVSAKGDVTIGKSTFAEATVAVLARGTGALTMVDATIMTADPATCRTGLDLGDSAAVTLTNLASSGVSYVVATSGAASVTMVSPALVAPPSCKKPTDAQNYASFAVSHSSSGLLDVTGGKISGANAQILASGPVKLGGNVQLATGQDGVRVTGAGALNADTVLLDGLTHGIWSTANASAVITATKLKVTNTSIGFRATGSNSVAITASDFAGTATGAQFEGNLVNMSLTGVDFGFNRPSGTAVVFAAGASGYATLTNSRFVPSVQGANNTGFYAAGTKTDGLPVAPAGAANFRGHAAGVGGKF